MDYSVVLILACAALVTSAWSIPYYPIHRAPLRVTRFAPGPPHHLRPHHREPVQQEDTQWTRPKRDHDDYGDEYGHREHGHRDHGHRDHGTSGVTGPVHTFVKTDKNANYKWGVRHHVGNKYAS